MAIFIADDSEIVRSVVVKSLSLYDEFATEKLITAENGKIALEKIKTSIPEIKLYILDVNMPEMSGIELVKEIRKLDANNPIIMLTTETHRTKMLEAKENGATGWVVKPFETEKFIQVLRSLLKK